MSRYSRGERYKALAVLFLVGLANYVDRVTFHVLQIPIKETFQLSDTQLGILTGAAFSIPHLLVTLPAGRIADRVSRKWVLMIALTIWASMTMGLGLAGTFFALIVLRMGVAIGEAFCMPASHSLIADYFPRIERARAMAILTLSLSIGSMIGLSAGGIFSERLGWRVACFIVGGLSLAIVPVIWFFFREPVRLDASGRIANAVPPPLGTSLAILWRIKSLRFVALGGALQSITALTLLHWSAPFYGRSHGLNLSEVGVMLGVMIGVSGGIGTFASGYLSDKLGARDVRWTMWVPALTCLIIVPALLTQFLAQGLALSVVGGLVAALTSTAFAPPMHAAAQSLAPANLRSLTSAAVLTLASLIGSALGGVIIGVLSDVLSVRGGLGEDGLRYAICVTVLFSLAAALCFFIAARLIADDLHAASHAEALDAEPA